MAKKTFTLEYSIGPSHETGHVTKLRNDLYRMFHVDYDRVVRRRDLNAEEYEKFMDELFERYPQAKHDFDSIHGFRDYVAFGRFDVDKWDWEDLLMDEDRARAYA